MLVLSEKLSIHKNIDEVIALPFETRQKSRFRHSTSQGVDVGVTLERGTILKHGDLLTGPEGKVIKVESLPEAVSKAHAASHHDLARAAYHLGNRHVAVQVGDGWLCFLQDHVLDAMCQQLGLTVSHEVAPFEPETGAYGGHHSHG